MSDQIETNEQCRPPNEELGAEACSAFSDAERLTWLIRENAYSLIDPSWAKPEEDPQQAVRKRIDKHMIRRPNALHELPPPCGSECNQDATGG